MTPETTTKRYLTDEQIASYQREGYLALPRFIDPERVEALRRVTDAFVERSRGVARTDPVFDLDPRHTAAAPVVRRIKNPADHDPLYLWLAQESPILDVVSELIGASLRFHHSKLNLKGSLIGAPVEVHQDAAFYPHSNDDVLAVGLLLDDATADNGAMAVLPGSHHGPIYTHFDSQGRFVGCMRAEDIARAGPPRRRPAGPAGRQHPHPPLPADPLVGAQHLARRSPPPHQLLLRRRLRQPRVRLHRLPDVRTLWCAGRGPPSPAARLATCRCPRTSARATTRSTKSRPRPQRRREDGARRIGRTARGGRGPRVPRARRVARLDEHRRGSSRPPIPQRGRLGGQSNLAGSPPRRE